MNKYCVIIVGMFCLNIVNVNAGDCDGLQSDLKVYDEYCEHGKKGTNFCGILGTIAAPFTMGLSLTACIIPAATTEWICRHKDWLIKSLVACNSGSQEIYWSKAWNDQKRAERTAEIKLKIEGFAKTYNDNINYSMLRYTSMLDTFQNNCNRNGFSIEADENKEYISAYLKQLQIRYDMDLVYYYDRYQYRVWQYSNPDEQKAIFNRMGWGQKSTIEFHQGMKVYEQVYKLDPLCQPKNKDGL